MEAYIVMNERLYKAIPVQWRSIIKKVKVNTKQGNGSTDIITSEAYLYPPARVELDGTTDTAYIGEGYHIPWFVSQATRVKFLELYVNYNPTIYTDSTDPTQLTSNKVKEGDFWKPGDCYYYILDEEWVKRHERYLGISKKAVGAGYWIRATSYTERTPNTTPGWQFVVGGGGNTINSSNVQDTNNHIICFSL